MCEDSPSKSGRSNRRGRSTQQVQENSVPHPVGQNLNIEKHANANFQEQMLSQRRNVGKPIVALITLLKGRRGKWPQGRSIPARTTPPAHKTKPKKLRGGHGVDRSEDARATKNGSGVGFPTTKNASTQKAFLTLGTSWKTNTFLILMDLRFVQAHYTGRHHADQAKPDHRARLGILRSL